jgi:tRNA-Thr(GGU) m(6)t(6)A37 methyltransferase TsaA
MSETDQPSLTLRPIGYVRTDSINKFDAPSQPKLASPEQNVIELLPDHQFELALQDLMGFDRIWLVWWFHRNSTWRPRVLPPRGPAKRRGVFATRSPHRPNPLGLTCAPLISVSDRRLVVGPLDLVDGTPILDIKPYLPAVDSFPESRIGWLEEVERAERAPRPFRIELSAQADRQLRWLKENWGVDFTDRAFEILTRDPRPHRTRRILQIEENLFRIACGGWRMYYQVSQDLVQIQEVQKGYSDETLHTPGNEKVIDREAQIAFAKWVKTAPDSGESRHPGMR